MSELLVTGDLVLDEPDAAHWLSGIAPALQAADFAIGHLEVPHTLSRLEEGGDIPAPGAPPENLAAIAAAGALLGYVKHTQRVALPHVQGLVLENESEFVTMDAATGQIRGFFGY